MLIDYSEPYEEEIHNLIVKYGLNWTHSPGGIEIYKKGVDDTCNIAGYFTEKEYTRLLDWIKRNNINEEIRMMLNSPLGGRRMIEFGLGRGWQSEKNIIVYDSFTDTDGMFLANHTPDIYPTGSIWFMAGINYCKISSNKAIANAIYSSNCIETNESDVDISGTFYTGSNPNVGIFLRNEQTTTDRWAVVLSPTSFLIQKRTSNSWSTLDTYAITTDLNTEYTIRATAVGNVITGYLNGVARVSVTNAEHNDHTEHGLIVHDTDAYCDDFYIRKA